LRMGVSHVELDLLYWEPGWQPAQRDVFRGQVCDALAGPTWVVDGNYRQVRDIVWSRADTIVWLDFSIPVIYARLIRRTTGRVLRRDILWNGNRESVRDLFSRDSLFLWALTYRRERRPDVPRELALPENKHLAVVRLASPRDARRWLREVTRAS
jgi:adenylate kinase family enzyme